MSVDSDDLGTVVNANPWVFIHQDSRWYGATWEWMRLTAWSAFIEWMES